MPTAVRSFAKINLGLRIGPTGPGGYHALRTMYQTIAAHDIVTITAKPAAHTHLTLTSNHQGVPTDSRNTAWRIVEKALQRLQIKAEAAIHIQKNLPIQGGIGAGSANAAAALLGLERELNTALPRTSRLLLAAEVGSDVPLFLLGGTSVGIGHGEQLVPYPDLPKTHCVLAIPATGVSTPAAFQQWDQQIAEAQNPNRSLTQLPPSDRLEELGRIYASVFTEPGSASIGASGVSWAGLEPSHAKPAGDLAGNPLLALVRTGIENDFEEVVFLLHSPLRAIKQALQGHENGSGGSAQSADSAQPALFAGLSGSGSALFGLYHSLTDAEAARRRVETLGVQTILTSTLPRSEYWQTMFL